MFIYSKKNVLLEMIDVIEEIYYMSDVVRLSLVVVLSISLFLLLKSNNTKRHKNTHKKNSKTFRDLFTYDIEEDF